jgi:predicted Zn-dependent peptidase
LDRIMRFEHKKLDNGLVLIGEINPAAKSAAIGFFVRTGSRDETGDISGVSHFLEHMMFKGNERLTALEVNEAFDRIGAQFNAFTSEENTVYYASVLPEYLLEVTRLWSELMRPSLRDDDFNIEKNVIKEEIAMYEDTPTFDVIDRCRALHFGSHPCGNSVLGTVQSIDALNAGQMREYFGRRYAPNNLIAACAGNFDWEQFCATVQAICGSWQPHGVDRKLDPFDGTGKSERLAKGNLNREHICLAHAGVSAQDPRRFAASLFAIVAGDDLGSRMYWELVDKAIAEAASMHFSPMDGTGMFDTYVRCSTAAEPRVMEIVNRVFAELADQGITQEELVKAQNKVLSALVIKNELPMGRLVDLGFNWVYLQEYRSIEDDVAAIKCVTIDEVNDLIRQLNPGRYTQYSLGPATA